MKEEIDIKIELLELIKADLEQRHKTLVEAFDALKQHTIFHRDGDEALLNEMHSMLIAINEINRFLYPFYWEKEGKV